MNNPSSPPSPMASNNAVKQEFSALTVQQKAEIAATSVAAAAKAEIESAYVMAIKRPRNEDIALAKIQNACRNIRFAESAEYAKPIGNRLIKGLSIRFAEEMNRHWGNIKCQQFIIYEDDERRVVQVIVMDLESNESYSKQIVIEKQVERKFAKGREILSERLNTKGERVYIVRAIEDEILVKEGALVSKAIRDNSLRLIPHHIKEIALDTIHDTVKSGVNQDPEKSKKLIIEKFSQLNIMPDKIEKIIGHSLDSVNFEEIVRLKEIFNSLREGEAKIDDFINQKTPEKADMPQGDPNDFFVAGDEKTHKKVNEKIDKKTV